MEQSTTWEANRFSATQEIPCILWNLKVHYHIHKSLSPVHVLSQINPVHAPIPISWRSILMLSSHLCLGLPSGVFFNICFSKYEVIEFMVCTVTKETVNSHPGFPTKTLYAPFLSPHTCYIPCPSHSQFDHPNNIWRSRDHYAPCYPVFSTPLLPCLS